MDYAYALEKRMEWLQWARDPNVHAQHNATFNERSFDVYLQILERGDTFFMNKRFGELVDVARRTIPDDLKFETDWMVSPYGFMWLEDPFEIPKPIMSEVKDINLIDKIATMRVSAIGWQRLPDHYVTLENKKDGKFIQKALGDELKQGAYQFVCFLDWRYFNQGADNGFGMWSYFVLNPGSQVLERIHRFENNSIDSNATASYPQDRTSDMVHEIRWIYTAMHLMSQKLATQKAQQPTRPTRRRMQKTKVPFVPLVKVITLRRLEQKSEPTGPSREIDWQFQWPVYGHWRQQWMPSIGEHRTIWIEDYIKGPPEKPFKAPQTRIFKVER